MKKKSLTILGIVSLLVITLGVTYAFFNYTKQGTTENNITTGTIEFLYTEVNQVGAGISIEDALPMVDSAGKVQTGSGNVFNFKVTAKAVGKVDIPYEVTARKKANSTLDEEAVRVYLTEVNGTEQQLLLDNYDNLTQTSKEVPEGVVEKTIYTGHVPTGSTGYEKNFKLRMWLDSNVDFSSGNYNGKTFTLTVNVYANAKTVTTEEIDMANTTRIENVMINNTTAVAAPEEAPYDYQMDVDLDVTNTNINIETTNEDAKVEVRRLDNIALNNNIKRMASSKTINLPLEVGDNYFEVKVTSSNRQQIDEYILKIVRADLVDPNVTVSVNAKVATLTLTDNVGVVGYKVTTSTTVPIEWDTISSTTSTTKSYTAPESGTYYAHIKDVSGRTSYVSFVISEAAFCQYNPGDVVGTYSYTGNSQTFTTPCKGTYKVELWGAQGGSMDGYIGGKGAYTKGQIYLNSNKSLYLYVGSQGSDTDYDGGYNGGGQIGDNQIGFGRNGGGATDMRLTSGTWNDFNSLKSRIMVAAGGGGANNRNFVTDDYYFGAGNGGAGGALIGINGESPDETHTNPNTGLSYGWYFGTGGTQTAGGHEINNEGVAVYYSTGAFGYAVTNQSGGGSGYYAGGSTGHGGAGGGSSFISGYTGCNAIAEGSTVDNIIHTNQPNHYLEYIFSNSSMIAGNSSMPTTDGSSTMIGNTGNGYAKITLMSF